LVDYKFDVFGIDLGELLACKYRSETRYQDFNQLLGKMIEREKKARLIERLMQIADEGDFL
jgi:hypothetical protein